MSLGSNRLVWWLSIILLGSVLFGIAVIIVLALIPLYLDQKSTNPYDASSPFDLAYTLSANLSSHTSNGQAVALRGGALSKDQVIHLQQIFQEKLNGNSKSSNIRVSVDSAEILSQRRSSPKSTDLRANGNDQFTIYRTNNSSDFPTDRLNVSVRFSCRFFCTQNLVSFVLQNVLDQFNMNETLYFSLFAQTVSLTTTTSALLTTTTEVVIPNGTVLNSDIKDTRILQINNITVFGTKDYLGNVQQVYAVQTVNAIYTIDQGRIVQIQTNGMTMAFQYNGTGSHYTVNIVTENSSSVITVPSSAPNVPFPAPKFNLSRDVDIPNPLTGIILQVKDQNTGRSIDDAVLQLSYTDDQAGNNTVVMMNVGGGQYYLPLPNNDTTADHLFNAENFRSTTAQQCEALRTLMRAYPMADICSKNTESSKAACSLIANEMASAIPDSLRTAANGTNRIPVQSRSFGALTNFQTVVSAPGESSVTTVLNSSNQVDTQNGPRSARNIFQLSMLVLNIFRILIMVLRGRCNEQTVAGGNIPDDRIIYIGQSQIGVKFRYETYVIPDEIQVYYEGNQVFTSTCMGTYGERETVISMHGNESSLRVNVIPNCEGDTSTAWVYSIECPSRLTCEDGHCTCGTNAALPVQVITPSLNQCGSNGGTFSWLIQWIGDVWGFSPACDDHDQCYGTCGSYKSDCDDSFRTSMRNWCGQRWISPTDFDDCLDWAERFYTAVHWFGNQPFRSGQVEDCTCFDD